MEDRHLLCVRIIFAATFLVAFGSGFVNLLNRDLLGKFKGRLKRVLVEICEFRVRAQLVRFEEFK